MYITYDGQEKTKCELKVFLIYNPKNNNYLRSSSKKKLNIPNLERDKENSERLFKRKRA